MHSLALLGAQLRSPGCDTVGACVARHQLHMPLRFGPSSHVGIAWAPQRLRDCPQPARILPASHTIRYSNWNVSERKQE